MSDLLPEKPLLFYPSLARRFGSDEALLLFQLSEQAGVSGLEDRTGTHLILSTQQWRALADFWDADRQMAAANSLVQQGVLTLRQGAAGTLTIQLLPSRQETAPQTDVSWQGGTEFSPSVASAPRAQPQLSDPNPANVAAAPLQSLPVFERPPPRRQPAAIQSAFADQTTPAQSRTSQTNLARQKGPAPTFGGSIGWRRHKDELENIFEQHEERNQRLQSMHLGWQPSEAFHELLPRHAIPAAFAADCLDEFVLYWLDKDRRESNWDQKYLAWVKREWVKKQTRDAREQRYEQERNATGIQNENTQRDTRDKRKRVTAAIMDLKDTDW